MKLSIDWNILHDIVEKAFELFELIWKLFHPEQKEALKVDVGH